MRVAVGLVLAALTAGCSSSTSGTDKPSAGNSGVVPPSLTARPAVEQKMTFGQSARMTFAPNANRSTSLQVTVDGVRAGRVRDLAAYAIDDQTKSSRPYYVRVSVTNLGPDDIGGSLVPLWASTSDGAVVSASAFAQPFVRCRSTPLPTPFAAAASTHTCLMYLVPRSATLVAMTNRTAAGDVAVTWTGTVKPPRKR